ncbi:MAG: trypsin-like peptidase domain-containing protein [Acidobacteria bacterium]|nr:trypsin-like peptidase domain-containing protein [Acidobacteriota bacterium]
MDSPREKILILDGDEPARLRLLDQLQSAVYDVYLTADCPQALETARLQSVDLVLLGTNVSGGDCWQVLTELKGAAATAPIRIIVLSSGGADERVRALDLGADDVLAMPVEPDELLARVRSHLRRKKAADELRRQARVAEESYQVAQTGFQALAVTERMTRDARALERKLKIGLTVFIAVAAVMAVTFFLYSRRSETEYERTRAAIVQFQKGLTSQEELLARTRSLREETERAAAASAEEQKHRLEAESQSLRERIATAASEEVSALRKQLDATSTRLGKIESEQKVAQGIIRSYASSVCLLHVSVAFRHKESGQRLRYAGLNDKGEPLLDSDGKPLFEIQGRGPEVRADIFGTGFLAAADGRILTNRHVVEPWWKDAELNAMSEEGFEAVIAEISAYFPDAPRAYRVEIQKISPVTDLAVVQGDMSDLKRAAVQLDGRREASSSGQAVVLMGYATGLDAILARAGEDIVRSIVQSSGGSPRLIMAELARRRLIRPLTTQGHIGDVLADKIVYDAQTTSGGSGGPLFNAQGKVIGVNYAVVRGFGGSKFGIPIRFADPLLKK